MIEIPLMHFEKEIENHFGIGKRFDITGIEIKMYLEKKYNNKIKKLYYNSEDKKLVIILKK